jgi:hypothetical protein
MNDNIAGKVVVITGAMRQPDDVDINEILYRLTPQEFQAKSQRGGAYAGAKG